MWQRALFAAAFIAGTSQPCRAANRLHMPFEFTTDDLESMAVDAVGGARPGAARDLRRALGQLGPTGQAQLGFRLRGDAIEFCFAGTYPFGECDPANVEYAVSLTGTKDHETLLSVQRDQMVRLAPIGRALSRRRAAGQPGVVDVTMAWEEGNSLRRATITGILHQEKPAERAAFVLNLVVNDAGLGGTQNFRGDGARLPQARVPAKVFVTIPILD